MHDRRHQIITPGCELSAQALHMLLACTQRVAAHLHLKVLLGGGQPRVERRAAAGLAQAVVHRRGRPLPRGRLRGRGRRGRRVRGRRRAQLRAWRPMSPSTQRHIAVPAARGSLAACMHASASTAARMAPRVRMSPASVTPVLVYDSRCCRVRLHTFQHQDTVLTMPNQLYFFPLFLLGLTSEPGRLGSSRAAHTVARARRAPTWL